MFYVRGFQLGPVILLCVILADYLMGVIVYFILICGAAAVVT